MRKVTGKLYPALLGFALAGYAAASGAAVTAIRIDALKNRHAISPYIYGVALGEAYSFNGNGPDTAAELADLNAPLNRLGGNNTSRYNWQINADNRGRDYYFESIGEASAVAGARADTFVSQSQDAGTETMITVPMIDWIAKLGPGRAKRASFSVAKYGAQTDTDPFLPDAGNGILQATGEYVSGNNPADANVRNSVNIQKNWIRHLVSTFGGAGAGGVRYYVLDNEHSIWHDTHRDVHPAGARMAEIRQKMIDYAGAIKAADPGAMTVGPEEYGWYGYFYSGYDQQYSEQHGGGAPDRDAHNGMNYVPWLLDQLRRNELATGKRSLDIFSLHWYPGSGEFSDNVSNAMQLLRNKSTRSLWDPNYIDAQNLYDPDTNASTARVMLIPRMKRWVADYYPGLPIAITEYNWGAEKHINGATAQADVYGIFGREGLDYAARWRTPLANTPTYKAMKLYRNYDGNKSGFGDTSVSALVPNPDQLSAFAAVRSSDGAMTVMVINKVASGARQVKVSLANFSAGGVAEVWQLTSANAIKHLPSLSFTGAALNATVPAQSITLFVLPARR